MLVFDVRTIRRVWKPVIHLLLAFPLLWLFSQWGLAFSGEPHGLGFNPHETSNRLSGDWAMRILLLSLLVTPLIRLTGSKKWVLLRRQLGLWAFAYGVAHLLGYAGLDKEWFLDEIWQDILKRTYITVGMAALVLMLPMALTSTAGMVKRLGARAWKRLHKLVYLIAPLVILHFFMMRKGIQTEPLVYGGILLVLLAFRVPWGKFRMLVQPPASSS